MDSSELAAIISYPRKASGIIIYYFIKKKKKKLPRNVASCS